MKPDGFYVPFCCAIVWALQVKLICSLPHPTCIYARYGFGVQLRCQEADLIVPGNFDVKRIPDDVESLLVTCPSAPAQVYCNVLNTQPEPIPRSSKITRAWLYGFRSNDGNRPAFAKLLQNIKHQITRLSFMYSRVGFLDAELFRGFSSLRDLFVGSCAISAVHPNTFQLLREVPAGAPRESVLREIQINDNPLEELDWSVFQPVAKSLEELHFQDTKPKLKSVFRSGPAFQISFALLKLSNNNLTSIPKKLLDDIILRPSASVWFQNNSFCSKPDCSCCELQEFMQWLGRVPNTSTVLFSCSGVQFSNHDVFPPNLYDNCRETTKPSPDICVESRPINISCSTAGVAFSETDYQTTDSTTAIFYSDYTFRCTMILHEMHHKVMELGGLAMASTPQPSPVIISQCQKGHTTINHLDPDASNARQLTVHTDLSEACQTKFVELLEYMQENIPSDNNLYNQSTTVDNKVSGMNSTLESLGDCRSDGPGTVPLVANCTGGRVSLFETDISLSIATTLFVNGDTSLSCRRILTNVYKHVNQTKNTVVDTGFASTDAVIAVCHKGQVIVSHYDPERSVEIKFNFHSGVNKRCRKIFRSLYGFLRGVSREGY